MYKELSFCGFCDEFSDQYRHNFSYEGKKALFEYFEEYEESTGEKVECDIIAFCCEYTEYNSAYEAMQQYQPDDMPVEGEEGDDLLEITDKNEAEALRWLQDNTQVIELENGGVIIQDF